MSSNREYHFSIIDELFASIRRIMFFKLFSGIRELLLQRRVLPELVIQIFVALAVARPSAM
jgi:hypothetical protein